MEIHKPHAAKTWKEFFIELGTIVAGILIAIALEQTVEFVRHVYQLRTVRTELLAEIEQNLELTARNEAAFASIRVGMNQNIAALRAGQTGHGPGGVNFDYAWRLARTQDGAWQAAKEGSALELMPREELRRYTFVYHTMDDFMAAIVPAMTRLQVAQAIAQRAPDGALAQRDKDELLAAISEAQGQLAFAERIMRFEAAGLKRILDPGRSQK